MATTVSAPSVEFHWFARAGLIARGAVYAIVGVLALKLALGDGGKATTQQGALKTLAKQPSGKVLLIVLAVGLAGYAAWRLTIVKNGDGFKERIGALIGAVVYGGLCVTAIQIVAGSGASSSSHAKSTTGGVLGWDGGQLIVGAVGAIFVFEALSQIRTGVTRSFCKKARTEEMHAAARKTYEVLGAVGHCARGVVFGLIGFFLIKAAVEFDPKDAIALDGALAKVVNAPAGPVLLGVVAAGLLAFALYCFADARYRKI